LVILFWRRSRVIFYIAIFFISKNKKKTFISLLNAHL
jgi:hypothetical protein